MASPAEAAVVRLTRPTMRRAGEFLDAVARSRDLHRPWAYPPRTVDALRGSVRRQRGGRSHVGYWVRTGDGELAGAIEISEIVRGAFLSGYLGYYAFVPHDGKGFMRAGLRAVLAEAFGPLRLHRLEANIQPENARSIALARRCGLRREGLSSGYLKVGGRWRDHERWAITAERWRAGRQAAGG